MTVALVLLGRLITFDPARREVEDGALYIGADERIAAVRSRTDPAPGGFGSARRVETKGLHLSGPDRPAQPRRLQHPAALVAARDDGAVCQPQGLAEARRL
jgi:hypothetical protein